jgi:hypothetical protein
MSTIFDIGESMTITERYQWAYAFAVLVTSGAYFTWLGIRLTDTPASDVEFVRPLLWTLGASFLIHTFARGFAAHAARGDSGTDERDRQVSRRADSITYLIFSSLAAIPLALGLADVDTFWITNALFLAFSLAALTGVALRVWLYRKGDLA